MVAGQNGAAEVLTALVVVVLIQRAAELRLARRNERLARAAGAREYGSRHYPWFFVLHGFWLLGWVLEALWTGVRLSPYWVGWIILFGLAGGLRYWAILSLGTRWNTRILVLPGVPPVTSGPYRYLSRPNYCAVALELLALPLVFGAVQTAVLASAFNALLLLAVRIPAERRALSAALRDDVAALSR